MKKILAIVTIIITLLAFSVNTFALTASNESEQSSAYRSWSNINGIEIQYDDYSVNLDYTQEVEENAQESAYNNQIIVTDNVILRPIVRFRTTLNHGEYDDGTYFFEMPYFTSNSTSSYKYLELSIINLEVDSLSYVTEDGAVYIAYARPVGWMASGDDTIQFVDGQSALLTSMEHINFTFFTWLENNTYDPFIAKRERNHYGYYETISTDNDYLKFSQKYSIQKEWLTGTGSPVILTFSAKNAVIYPEEISYNSRYDYESTILPNVTFSPGDNVDESKPIPNGWYKSQYAVTTVSYTYFIRQTSANGEGYIQQYRNTTTLYQYSEDIYNILPHPAEIFSEDIYKQLVGIIYEDCKTSVYYSRALNDFSFTYRDTLMRNEPLTERNISNFIKNVRYYPTEQLHFSDLGRFLSNIGDGFFNANIFGIFSIADILFVIIAIGAVVVFLKLFAGG